MTQARKDRIAARDFHELLNPLDAGDQRLVPLFEKHTRTRREPGSRFADLLQPALQLLRELFGAIAGAHNAADDADGVEDLRNRTLIEREHGVTAPDQFLRKA